MGCFRRHAIANRSISHANLASGVSGHQPCIHERRHTQSDCILTCETTCNAITQEARTRPLRERPGDPRWWVSDRWILQYRVDRESKGRCTAASHRRVLADREIAREILHHAPALRNSLCAPLLSAMQKSRRPSELSTKAMRFPAGSTLRRIPSDCRPCGEWDYLAEAPLASIHPPTGGGEFYCRAARPRQRRHLRFRAKVRR